MEDNLKFEKEFINGLNPDWSEEEKLKYANFLSSYVIYLAGAGIIKFTSPLWKKLD